MKIKIKTSEIDFEFEDNAIKYYDCLDRGMSKTLLEVIKDCITKVVEETVNIETKRLP